MLGNNQAVREYVKMVFISSGKQTYYHEYDLLGSSRLK